MQLDRQQKQAVETSSELALVLAGAGSGKTRVLIERVAYLIEQQKVSPYEICCLTFTRKAAGEMRERLQKRLGNQAYKVTIGTMHSIALALLKRFGEVLGYRPTEITVYGDWEEQQIIKEAGRMIGLYNGKSWKKIKIKDFERALEAHYTYGLPFELNDVGQEGFDLYHTMQQLCRENNALTYGQLLLELRRIFPSIHQYLNWRHVLVDEAQDLNHLQWDIIHGIINHTMRYVSLFVVGDQDQSIYEWRGALPHELTELSFMAEVFKLETNYRSCPEIVAAGNAVISHNQERIPKAMQAARDDAGNVKVWTNMDSAGLVSKLSRLPASSPMAILARNHGLLAKLSQILSSNGIEHTYIGQKSKLTNTELFRRFHAFLKLLVNPHDNFSFMLIKDLIQLSDEDYQSIRTMAASSGQSHCQVWINTSEDTFTDFFVFHFTGYLSASTLQIQYMATGAAPFPSQGWGWETEEVMDVTRFIWAYLTENPNSTIKDYLDWLATFDVQDEIQEERDDQITLATIHAAKGLQWPVVIVAGVNEGTLPSKRAMESDDIEAERRLAYVAWTRAEDHLVLTVRPELQISRDGKRQKHTPRSRFICESLPQTQDTAETSLAL